MKFGYNTGELRPGLFGWAALNAAALCKQVAVRGAASPAMVLVNVFQLWYARRRAFSPDELRGDAAAATTRIFL